MHFSYQFLPDGSYTSELKAEEIVRGLGSPGTLWVHFYQLVEDELGILSQVFKFHPLAIEDCLHRHTHPKIEEYENCLFLVVYTPGSKAEGIEKQLFEHFSEEALEGIFATRKEVLSI